MTPLEAKTYLAAAKQRVIDENTRAPLRQPAIRAQYLALANAQARAVVYWGLATHASDKGGGVVTPAIATLILQTANAIATSKVLADPNAATAVAAVAQVDPNTPFDSQVSAVGTIAGNHVGVMGEKTAVAANSLISTVITASQSA